MSVNIGDEKDQLRQRAAVLRALTAFFRIGREELSTRAGYSPESLSSMLNEREDRLTSQMMISVEDAFLDIVGERREEEKPLAMINRGFIVRRNIQIHEDAT